MKLDTLKLTSEEKEIIKKYERYNASGFRPRVFFDLPQEESDELMNLKKLIVEHSNNAEQMRFRDANSDETCLGRKVIIPTSTKDIEKLRETVGYPGNIILAGIDEVSLKKQKIQVEECILFNETEIKEELLEINGEKVKGKNLTLYVADRALDILKLETKINKHL